MNETPGLLGMGGGHHRPTPTEREREEEEMNEEIGDWRLENEEG